jgi:hypothetical protein
MITVQQNHDYCTPESCLQYNKITITVQQNHDYCTSEL